MSPARSFLPAIGRVGCALLLGLGAGVSLPAQTAITSITTTVVDGTASTVDGVTYQNDDLKMTSFTTASKTYNFSSTGTGVNVDRESGTANPNQSSIWMAENGSTTNVLGTYQSNYGNVFLGDNLYMGSDNTFANGTTTQDANIEKIDFILNGTTGLTASAAMAFAIFDRGAAGAHDPVEIAAITSLGNGDPSTYTYSGNLLTVTTAEMGSTNDVANFTYTLFRYNNGNNTTTYDSDTETGTQGIGGAVVTTADLGIANGTTIYGYSLMAADVTDGGNIQNLANWNNTTYFPTNSSDATGGAGGIDLAGVNGVVFTQAVVPEPTAYGAVMALAALGLIAFRQRRIRRSASFSRAA